jgi:signal transduction histidine kinase
VAAYEAGVTPAASSAGLQNQVRPVQVSWQQSPEEMHPVAAVIRTGEVVIRAPLDPQSATWQPFERTYPAAAALPLTLEGSIRAVLCLYSQQAEFFQEEKTQLLQSLTNLAGIALQNAQLFEQVLAGRQRLQALSRRLVEVQEEERRAIALELHDEIGQILTGLKLLLDSGAALPPEKLAGQLQQAQEVVNELIQRVRQLSLDLRPAMLDDLGLLPALLWLFDHYTSQTRVKVTCQHSRIEGERFPPEFETTAYRVVQEGLTNIARYAGTGQAAVRLWNDGSILGIQIQDKGCGFDPEAVLSSGNSRGLLGMRERAYSLGGWLAIDSAPGQGTCLTVEFPLSGHLERRRNARTDSAGG